MSRRYQPAQFGDLSLRHEVHVFPYRYCSDGPEYLLLQATPVQEKVWRPVVGPVDWDEDLRHAALRQVQAETGLTHAFDLVSPATGLVQEVGDLKLVQWPVGYQVAQRTIEPRLKGQVAGWDWCGFEQALHILDASLFRQNLLQLHLQLAA